MDLKNILCHFKRNGNEENDEILPTLPFKRFNLPAIGLHAAMSSMAKYAKSRANRVVVAHSEDPLLNISATEAAKQIREGKLKSLDLVRAYIKRIRDVNPFLNAVTEVFEHSALTLASEADEFIKNYKGSLEELAEQKPLLGIPVSIKHQHDYIGYRNICGLTHLRNTPIAKSNTLAVQRVLDAGGIPTCFTNVPTACFGVETHNCVYGRTVSPHDNRTTCGGSSGGEGALIAAQGSLVGIGSDLAGSIRIPAMLCGIYGFKPGHAGPLEGMLPPVQVPPELDGLCVVAPLARYAEDIPLLYYVLYNIPVPKEVSTIVPTKLYSCAPNDPPFVVIHKDVRLIWEDIRNFVGHTYNLQNKHFELHKQLHEFIVMLPAITFENPKELLEILAPGEHISVLKEFVKSFVNASNISPSVLQGVLMAHSKVDEKVVKESKRQVQILRRKMNEALKDNGILIFPSLPQTHYFHYSIDALQTLYTLVFNVLGLAALAVPVGKDRLGYPLAVQLVGHQDSDQLLFNVAGEIEKKFGGWVKPKGVEYIVEEE